MTTLVIGANRGIGLEIAKQLSDRGDEVVATYRSNPGELNELGVDTIEGVDVRTDEGVRNLIEGIDGQTFDTVYVVAGVLKGSGLGHLDFDTIRDLFDINAVGPLKTTEALVKAKAVTEGSKIGLLTSRMGSIADNTSGGSYAYRMSKAALNCAGKSLAMDLQDDGVAVVLLHPGWVRTDMTNNNGLIDVDASAEGLIRRMDSLTLEETGTFWHTNGEELPW